MEYARGYADGMSAAITRLRWLVGQLEAAQDWGAAAQVGRAQAELYRIERNAHERLWEAQRKEMGRLLESFENASTLPAVPVVG